MSVSRPVVANYFCIADEGPRIWAVKLRRHTPFHLLTRLYLAFAWIRCGRLTYYNTADDPTDQQRIAALVGACRAANPAAEVFISSGYDSDGSMYREAAGAPEVFAQSVVSFLREHGLDGYDMDWENGLQQGPLHDLLTAVREALDTASAQDGKTYKLTLAVWPSPTPAYDLQTMAGTVDEINIMSYGAGLSLPECVAAYRGFPASKMIGGVNTETNYPGDVDTLGPNGTIAQKAGYAWQNGLAGMVAWRLDNDYAVGETSSYLGATQLYDCMPVPVFLYTAQDPLRYHYTTSPFCGPGPGWTAQGIAFHAFGAEVQTTAGQAVVPVQQYRARDPQRYRLTTGAAVGPGWRDDQVTAFCAFRGRVPGAVPVYQYHTLLPPDNVWNLAYSLSPNDSGLAGWTNDGPAFYGYGPST